MRAVAGTALDDLLLEGLLPALDDVLPDDADSRVWIDEVARPSLIMMRDFALRRVDDLVAGRPVNGDTLRAGLSLMIGKIVLNNVVVLTDILLDHVTESVSDAAQELSDALRDDAGHPLADPAAELARSVLATFGLQFDTIADASRVLAAELLLALSEATSDEVLTDERRATVRTLTRRILFTAYGEADLSSPDALDDTLSQLAACAYIPAPDAVGHLIAVQIDTLAEQVAVALPRVEAALEAFVRAAADEPINQLERGAADLLRQGRDQIVRLAGQLLALSRAVQHWLEEASEWTREKESQLAAAAAALRKAKRRQESSTRSSSRASAKRKAPRVVPSASTRWIRTARISHWPPPPACSYGLSGSPGHCWMERCACWARSPMTSRTSSGMLPTSQNCWST